MKARFIVVNVFNHQLYTHQKWLSEMYENRVHFKFLFGPIYLFTPFPPILSWLCLCVWKKHLQPKSRCASHGSVAGEHHCILSSYGCWFTVMEGSNWPWKSSRPHQQLRLSLHFLLKDAEIKLVNQVSYTFKNIPKVVRVPRVPISAQCSSVHVIWTLLLVCPCGVLGCWAELLESNWNSINLHFHFSQYVLYMYTKVYDICFGFC